MPVLADRIATGSPPPADLGGAGTVAATWYAPDGSVWPMSRPERGWYVTEGVKGVHAAVDVEVTTDDHPRGGVRVRNVQPLQRNITWPIHVYADDHLTWLSRWRQLAEALTQTDRLGPGWLQVARPDGTARRIACYYDEGLDEDEPEYLITSDTMALTLLAETPWWEDTAPTIIRREYALGRDFLNPYPSVSSSQVLGDTTVTNPGGATAWPYWHVTGPATAITGERLDTGESFTLTPPAPLEAGQVAEISTDPPRITGPNGENWMGGLNWPGAILWGLPPGSTRVSFRLDGDGPGSAVELRFYARHRTA